MTLPLLRDDSLITTPDGAAVRVSLPWIRSLPLTSLQNPIVTIDGVSADEVTVVVGDRRVPAGRADRGRRLVVPAGSGRARRAA